MIGFNLSIFICFPSPWHITPHFLNLFHFTPSIAPLIHDPNTTLEIAALRKLECRDHSSHFLSLELSFMLLSGAVQALQWRLCQSNLQGRGYWRGIGW